MTLFYSEITALYTNGQGNPIYFEGTDPRDPGVPNSSPVVGTPREQFEEGLTVLEWHAYMDVIGQHNMYIYMICYLISADYLNTLFSL